MAQTEFNSVNTAPAAAQTPVEIPANPEAAAPQAPTDWRAAYAKRRAEIMKTLCPLDFMP